MADNRSKFSMSSITTRQKVIGAATVIIFIFLIYEVMGMFGGGGGQSAAPPPVPVATAAKPPMSAAPGGAMPAANMMPPGTQVPAMAAMTNPNQLTQASVLTVRKDTDVLKNQDEQQKAYLDSLNQLQLLKLKRDIAETNQAIATARLATETANKSMSDLLTTPAPPMVPASAYANKLAGTGAPTIVGTEEVKPTPPPIIEIPYTVISVSMQFEHWNAVLGYQDKLFSVTVGDTLIDGSKVVSINRGGVVIVKDGKRKKLNILSSI